MSFDPVPARDYLPQKAPFAMVDELLFAGASRTRTQLTVRQDNVLAPAGYLSTGGLVEAMAQTAAAGTGYLHRSRGEPVPVGYIGAVQKLSVHAWPGWNDRIEIEVEQRTQVLHVSLVACTVYLGGETIANCEMKIFIDNLKM